MGKPGKKEDRLLSSSLYDEGDYYPDSIFSDENTVEDCYRREIPLDHRKSLAQFFTPKIVASMMARWVAEIKPKDVLDPSVGPGILVEELLKVSNPKNVDCVDIDAIPLAWAKTRLCNGNISFFQKDFLTLDSSKTYDAIISNPPYLRHHDLNYSFDIYDSVGRLNGIKLSKLSNLYILFILEICRRLNDGGRAAIIVPAEWVNANFGLALKKFFYKNRMLNSLVYFSHESLPFAEALTTASVLLIEKTKKQKVSSKLKVAYVSKMPSSLEWAKLADCRFERMKSAEVREFDWTILGQVSKWDNLFARGVAVKSDGLSNLGKLCNSRRGIATGANDYFHITRKKAEEIGISPENLRPCIGRAQDVAGLIFSKNDLAGLENNDSRTLLVSFTKSTHSKDLAYIEHGEALGLNKRYLLSCRTPWYSMEQRPQAPIWAAVFGREGMRFIFNKAGIANLTTFHCLYPKGLDDAEIAALVAMLNSKPIQERAMSHRRVYGGGLIKFEPKDLLEIEIVDVKKMQRHHVEQLAGYLTEMDQRRRKKAPISSDQIDEFIEDMISEYGVVGDIIEDAPNCFQAELF